MSQKQQWTIGAVIEIKLSNGTFAYGQLIAKSAIAFFNFNPRRSLENIKVLETLPVFFILAVYSTAVSQGRWKKIGELPLDRFSVLPDEYMQDNINIRKFNLYKATGAIIPATRAQCVGKELCAVWEYNHVEDRLKDNFSGNFSCQWGETLTGGLSYYEKFLIRFGHLSPEYDPWNPDPNLLDAAKESLRSGKQVPNDGASIEVGDQ